MATTPTYQGSFSIQGTHGKKDKAFKRVIIKTATDALFGITPHQFH
jgi:hypothetical protein